MAGRTELVGTDDGVQLWHASSGAGLPVILCHGGPGLWDYLEPLVGLVVMCRRCIDGISGAAADPRVPGRTPSPGWSRTWKLSADTSALTPGSWPDTRGELSSCCTTRSLTPVAREGSSMCLQKGSMDSWRDVNRATSHEREASRTTASQRDTGSMSLAGLAHRTPDLEREFRLLSWFTDLSPGFDAETLMQEMLDAPYEINVEANRELARTTGQPTQHLRTALRLMIPAVLIHGSNDPRPSRGCPGTRAGRDPTPPS